MSSTRPAITVSPFGSTLLGSKMHPGRMMRKVRVLRKIFHVQRDVMFTMVLLLLFCLLLYTQQVTTPFTINRWQGNT